MSELLKLGVSGVTAYQRALQITGNNITNANVESYSRQEAVIDSRLLGNTGTVAFDGKGVVTEGIRRIVDEFMIAQVRSDTSSKNRMQTYLDNISPLDSFLAEGATGLSQGFERFFSALQAGSEDPSFVPVRQLILDEAEGMVRRFETLYGRLDKQQENINEQIRAIVAEINSVATGLADVNEAIGRSAGNTGLNDKPNELFDKRDELLRQLAEMINYNVIEDARGIVTVGLGTGLPLVFRNETNALSAKASTDDLRRVDVGFDDGNGLQKVNDQINAGKLGGLLAFRDEVLEPTFNELGRVAIVLADQINHQHQFGLDLDGRFGANFFSDINATEVVQQRIVHDQGNAFPDNRALSVTIEDVAELTVSDYRVEFNGPNNADFEVTRLSDDVTVLTSSLPGSFPVPYDFDGIRLSFESGSFQTGDSFLLYPTKFAANEIAVLTNRPQEIALAAPIITGASLGNEGGGDISQGEVLDIFASNGTDRLPTFATDGSLFPPFLIRFTSATTYDVLDNTDASSPVELVPPMRSRIFTPGGQNAVFATDPNQQSVESDTAIVSTIYDAGLLPASSNGYPAESLFMTFVDPDTRIVTNVPITTVAGASAAETAIQLSTISGVTAYADTNMRLNVTDTGGGAPLMSVFLNGEELTLAALGTVPDPVTNDFLRNRINSNTVLAAQGITAINNSDPNIDPTKVGLFVRSSNGVDLSWNVGAGTLNNDFLTIVEVNGQAPSGTAQVDVGDERIVGGTLTVEMANSGRLRSATVGGVFSIPPPIPLSTFKGVQVTLDGTPASGDEFTIDFNSNGVADNRNAIAMVSLEKVKTIDGNTISFVGAYGQLVEFVGSTTNQSAINADASETLLRQSMEGRNSVSGVNLDEEAARLIQFEQAYNASAQLIQVGRQLFDTILRMVG